MLKSIERILDFLNDSSGNFSYCDIVDKEEQEPGDSGLNMS